MKHGGVLVELLFKVHWGIVTKGQGVMRVDGAGRGWFAVGDV